MNNSLVSMNLLKLILLLHNDITICTGHLHFRSSIGQILFAAIKRVYFLFSMW